MGTMPLSSLNRNSKLGFSFVTWLQRYGYSFYGLLNNSFYRKKGKKERKKKKNLNKTK